MSLQLFRDDAYMRDARGTVVAHTSEGGVVLDASIFYPTGGGQPGDAGMLHWEGGQLEIATAVKGEGEAVVLVPSGPGALPEIGTGLRQSLDWERRYAHMRIHTALHLLSVVLAFPVTGGSIGAEKGRLDFMMEEPIEDREAVEAALNALVARDLPVSEDWISEAELDANPGLVKTMSVAPPRGAGRVRLVRIGEGDGQVDLQPCGGTHVARTGEIGPLKLGKLEKKGRANRRVNILFG
ncbi:alanyl-tRNA editing protein [Oceanicola sp. 502str15]|uniref:alanyl-tRNA editing protein n=1 Tax=Oceanicola sp. 502str15 TaxID=2696061 RepID=UPI00209414AE|nr:alanyl-tRNA editing protein [Oceanicola sp. 502str15]MCO6382495.1 alanyl-tRNA editing protein [Oceanicola sp. 502str15]